MHLLQKLALVASLTAVSSFAAAVAPAEAAVTPTSKPARAVLAGELGFVGGAAPGGFHPTSGDVEVEFTSTPLVLLVPVGKSGHFNVTLTAGTYYVVGCGPSSSGGSSGQCSKTKKVVLVAGEVDHIRLVWAMVP